MTVHVDIGKLVLAILLKMQRVLCTLKFKNEYDNQFPRDHQTNEKTKELYNNNNQHLDRNVCSMLYTTAVSSSEKCMVFLL